MEEAEEGNKVIIIISAAVFWFIGQFVLYLLLFYWGACEFKTITGEAVSNPFFHTYALCAVIMGLFIVLLICDSLFVYVANGTLKFTDIATYIISICIISYWIYVFANYWLFFQSGWEVGNMAKQLYSQTWSWFSYGSGKCVKH